MRRRAAAAGLRRAGKSSAPVVASSVDACRAGEHDREHAIQEMEVEAFILILSALQYLMTSEQQMMAGIIPHQYQKGIFEKISRESLDLVIRDSDAIIGRVKKASTSNDFLSIISIFQVVKQNLGSEHRLDLGVIIANYHGFV